MIVLLLAGCGGSGKPTVCNVAPSADGKRLIYSPPGCEKHLGHGSVLNIETAPVQ